MTLKYFREEVGLSLAEAVRLLSIDQDSLSKCETGYDYPSPAEIRTMEKVFKRDNEDIVDALQDRNVYVLSVADWNVLLSAVHAVRCDADAKGLRRSTGGGHSEMRCPKCKVGTIRYTLHPNPEDDVSGACDTFLCIRFPKYP